MRSFLLALLLVAIPSAAIQAQCRPGKDTNEAKLLAFYSAPLAFSSITPAEYSTTFGVKIIGEAEPVPKPDPEIQKTGACFTSKSENTSLSPVFGRPRITILLPRGFALEASYLPPVTIADATPALFGLSAQKVFPLSALARSLHLSVRGHAVRGNVKGPITCPRKSLQSSSPLSPCYGTRPSRDTFSPNVTGVELALTGWTSDRSSAFFLGGGENWLKPRFQVGFTSATGSVDNTRVEVDLTRTVLFGGYSRRFNSKLDATAEVYSVPQDVTLFRGALSYRLF